MVFLWAAALFTIARTWKQPRCPSTDEWIKKLWYICTMGYYSAIKRNAFKSVVMRWMNLEPIIQSDSGGHICSPPPPGVARRDLVNRKDNSRTGLHPFLRPVAGGNRYTREMDTDHTSRN